MLNRRGFFSTMLGGAAATAVAPHIQPDPFPYRYHGPGGRVFERHRTEMMRPGEMLIVDGQPIGIAVEHTKTDGYTLVQVYGPL